MNAPRPAETAAARADLSQPAEPDQCASAAAERVPVLMYHRVDLASGRADAGFNVTPERFAAQLGWLAEQGYTPCTLDAFERWLQHGQALPPRSVLITFDDGFAGLHHHAMPLLAARAWPATVFLVSALIGQRDNWRSQEFGGAGSDALLNRAQIDEMARHGIEFQSHSRSHADLTSLADTELHAEIAGSRHDLEQLLGRPVTHFAYPFGRFNARVQGALRDAGYTLGFSVESGFNRPQGHPLAVRRLDITGHDSRARFARKVALGSNDGAWSTQARYVARRALQRLGLAR